MKKVMISTDSDDGSDDGDEDDDVDCDAHLVVHREGAVFLLGAFPFEESNRWPV